MIDLRFGNCLEVMKSIPDKSIDAIICDLPYGTTACKWDSVIPFEPLWAQYKRIIKDNSSIVLTSSQPFTSALVMSNIKMFKYSWYWNGKRGANFAQAPYMPLKVIEDICVFSFATIAENSKNRMKYYPQGLIDTLKECKGKTANDHRPNRADQKPYTQVKTGYPNQLIEFAKDSKPVHPTQKPVALMEYLVKTYTNEGETVLDNCMGSGSTGAACKRLKRKFIGIEQDVNYFEIAKNRIKESE
ncbi:MAG: site-specific DNA-methyltransferase [Chitinophagaceae bacterium]|nr:site-specific DNA-methyltransferase [Chitinophagaceae bacterium]